MFQLFCGISSDALADPTGSNHTSRVYNQLNDDSCLPQYLSYFCILGILSITALQRLSHCVKMLLISFLVVLQIVFNLTTLEPSFGRMAISTAQKIGHHVTLSILLAVICVTLYLINRSFDSMARRLFLWQKEVGEQKNQVEDMRKKNEALVYNILPKHVAIHFLGRRKNDEELYSKSYDSVGVLFAAMPNFSDFYTEESVNNQGLECLRFLNEVISDFDALLEQPRFSRIIKIKTISSSYMAASGLNDNYDGTGGDEAGSTSKQWSHLAELTDFALTLKDTLNNINKESFNNFVLRMGELLA